MKTPQHESLSRRVSAAACIALGAAFPLQAAAAARTVGYAQPVERARIGATARIPGANVVPSGRLNSPAGKKTVVSGRALALATDATGHWLVSVTAGKTAAEVVVCDATTLRIVGRAAIPAGTAGGGLTILRDADAPGRQRVVVSTGTSGGIEFFNLEKNGSIAPADHAAALLPKMAKASNNGFAGEIGRSADGSLLLVVDETGGRVVAFDAATHKAVDSVRTGLSPHGILVVGDNVIVTNEGLTRPTSLTAVNPQYPAPVFDLSQASSTTIFTLRARGKYVSGSGAKAFGKTRPVPMDPAPHGAVVGGAHPAALAGGGPTAYVALTNVDRLSVVDLATAKVTGGTELRFYDKGPYGAEPTALALDTKHDRMYVAMAGMDAVAVLDIRKGILPHRLGLLATGVRPHVLRIAPNGRTLFVASEKGFGAHESSFLQRIDVEHTGLAEATRTSLRNLRRVVAADPPEDTGARVVHIRMPAASYDEVFGANAKYDAAVMPEIHRLAKRFSLATNMYSDARGPLVAEQAALSGTIVPYTLRTESDGRRAVRNAGALGPDDAPRYGYFFDRLSAAKIAYRNYGALPAMSRYAGHSDAIYEAALASGRADACANEFVRDHAVESDARFIEIVLPEPSGDDDDATAVAHKADAALAVIVKTLVRDPQWSKTTVIISPWRASGAADHIDAMRTYAVVIAPGAKSGEPMATHRSIVGLLKSEERLFGLSPSTLGDLVSTPIRAVQAGESNSDG